MDSLNRRIVKCLQVNARQSNAAISRQVGVSAPAVAERIRKMEDLGIIKTHTTFVDTQAFGYQLKAFVTLRAFMGKLKPFLENVKKWDEVVNCYRITGNENIIMEVIIRDQRHLEQFVDRVIQYGESKTQIVLSQIVSHNAVS